MTIEFRQSSEFSLTDLASVFTTAYEGYFVPIAVDEKQLEDMVDVFDLDLTRSLVAVERGRLVGLANLGLRGESTWLGGVGVVPDRRGSGVGEALTRMLLDQARDAGAFEMVLEVIVENAPAIALYEKLGFTHTRELDVLSLEGTAGHSRARETDLADALEVIAARRETPEPWQRADETVANLSRRRSPLRAIGVDRGAAVFTQEDDRINLVQAAGDDAGLAELITALRSRGTISAVNFPSDGRVATALHDAGATLRLRQHEMAIRL